MLGITTIIMGFTGLMIFIVVICLVSIDHRLADIKKCLKEIRDQYKKEDFYFCPSCGTRNLKNTELCVKCNASLKNMLKSSEFICSDCNSNVPENAEFCPNCGAKLKEESK